MVSGSLYLSCLIWAPRITTCLSSFLEVGVEKKGKMEGDATLSQLPKSLEPQPFQLQNGDINIALHEGCIQHVLNQ